MGTITLKNNHTSPLAIPTCPSIQPRGTLEIPVDKFHRYKNNPSVKNWLGTGRLEVVDGDTSEPEKPSQVKPNKETPPNGPALSDENIAEALKGSIDDATCVFKNITDRAVLLKAVETETNGKNRSGMLDNLSEILDELENADSDS